MNKRFSLILVFFLMVIFADSKSEYYYREYNPVFLHRSDLEKSVNYLSGERELQNTGKIYYKDSYIFINEPYKGIYVINNTEPAKPKVEGYITAPGSLDIAIKNSIMYIDNAVDLVAFDLISKKVTGRIRNVLPPPLAPGEFIFWETPAENMVLVGWNKAK